MLRLVLIEKPQSRFRGTADNSPATFPRRVARAEELVPGKLGKDRFLTP